MSEPGMLALMLVLGLAAGALSGYLGIGGGIVMAPALLYLPPLLGLGALGMQQVSGLTIACGLVACASGAWRHHRYRCVDRRLVLAMGVPLAAASLAGSVASRWVADGVLLGLLAGLAGAAALLLWLTPEAEDADGGGTDRAFDLPRAALIALGVGLLGGLVGQGGSFLLVPLMIRVLGLPTRLVLGSNLGLACLACLAGFAGKAATGQVPWLLAAALVAGAFPGAQLGGLWSHRTSTARLRAGLAVVIAAAALGMVLDAVIRR